LTTSCPFCDGPIKSHWREYSKCESCSLIYRTPMPTPEELVSIYNSSWESPVENLHETGSVTSTQADGYIQSVMEALNIKSLEGLTILDFGAGKGEMLQAFRDHGADAIGVEPFGHEHLVQNGFEVYETIGDVPADRKVDGIFSSNVVEHLFDPPATLQELHDLLKPDGWLFVTTPNGAGANAIVRGGQWREALKPVHLVFFNHSSMNHYLRDVGFSDVRRSRQHINYGHGITRDLTHRFLDLAGLEGELRYVAVK